MADNSVINSTNDYSQSQQLVILWICLGAGGFLCILIFFRCRAINQRRYKDIHFPPLAAAATPRRRQPQHVSLPQPTAPQIIAPQMIASQMIAPQIIASQMIAPQMIAPQMIAELRAAPQLTSARQTATAIRHYRKEAVVLKESAAFQDEMVQEMMMFTREALSRSARVEAPPTHSIAGSLSNMKPVELSSRPPADIDAATEEMLLYTNGILESLSIERQQPKSASALPSMSQLTSVSRAPRVVRSAGPTALARTEEKLQPSAAHFAVADR